MNLEDLGDLADGLSLADEALCQFCMLGIQLPRASEAGSSLQGRVAGGIGTFADEVAFKLGDLANTVMISLPAWVVVSAHGSDSD